MVQRSTKRVHLTAAQYKALLKRHSLRQVDAAWLCDLRRRQSINWTKKGVSSAPALLLKAFDEGLIPLEWFAANIKQPIP